MAGRPVTIYALLHPSGGIRYIGRALNPRQRVRDHWRHCGDDAHYMDPKNMFLRSLHHAGYDMVEYRILAVVEEQPGRNEDEPFIRAARRQFPGKLCNIYPMMDDQELELLIDLSEHLAEYDPEGFDRDAFREQIMWSGITGRADQLSKRNTVRWQDPEYRAAMAKHSRETIRKMLAEKWQDPEYIADQSARLTEKWNDPEWRAAMLEKRSAPECRAKQSAAAKAQWEDPEFAAKMAAVRSGDENCQRLASLSKQLAADPKERQRRSEAGKRQMSDPKRREAQSKLVRSQPRDANGRLLPKNRV